MEAEMNNLSLYETNILLEDGENILLRAIHAEDAEKLFELCSTESMTRQKFLTFRAFSKKKKRGKRLGGYIFSGEKRPAYFFFLYWWNFF